MGLEKYFEVSSLGRVKSKSRVYKTGKYYLNRYKKDKILKKTVIRNYNYVTLEIINKDIKYRKGKRVARLVAMNFIDNLQNKPQVNHINGNKLDDRVENLEWCTKSENILHAYRTGLKTSPEGNRKFTDKKIQKVRSLRLKGLKHREIAKRLKMGISTVTHILLGTRRKLTL